MTFTAFVKKVTEQSSKFNNNVDGTVNAIPIIGYHRIDNYRQDTAYFIEQLKSVRAHQVRQHIASS
jgi:hypothetical protein